MAIPRIFGIRFAQRRRTEVRRRRDRSSTEILNDPPDVLTDHVDQVKPASGSVDLGIGF
jgi:hypothetical protein